MRELGLDKHIAHAAEAVPDARERLAYIALMTERAAERALNAVETAQPMQERLAAGAKSLNEQWAQWQANPVPLQPSHPLVTGTNAFLDGVPAQASGIGAQLMEIMMAQDFQDLTGQVIMKMMDVINEVEKQLIQVLIDNAPKGVVADANPSLQNGPLLKPQASGVSSQEEADDLLASLGF
jgi:chemotaxis protein CheZ